MEEYNWADAFGQVAAQGGAIGPGAAPMPGPFSRIIDGLNYAGLSWPYNVVSGVYNNTIGQLTGNQSPMFRTWLDDLLQGPGQQPAAWAVPEGITQDEINRRLAETFGDSLAGPQGTSIDLGPAGGYPGAPPPPNLPDAPTFQGTADLIAQLEPERRELSEEDRQYNLWSNALMGLSQAPIQASNNGELLLGLGLGALGGVGSGMELNRQLEDEYEDEYVAQRRDWLLRAADVETMREQAQYDNSLARAELEYEYSIAEYNRNAAMWESLQPNLVDVQDGYAIYTTNVDGRMTLQTMPITGLVEGTVAGALGGSYSPETVRTLIAEGNFTALGPMLVSQTLSNNPEFLTGILEPEDFEYASQAAEQMIQQQFGATTAADMAAYGDDMETMLATMRQSFFVNFLMERLQANPESWRQFTGLVAGMGGLNGQ